MPVRSYRDNAAGGTVKFGRAFVVGFLITVVASSCCVATWEVIYDKFYQQSAHFDKDTDYVIDKANKSGATEAQIAQRTCSVIHHSPLTRPATTPLVIDLATVFD
jgi:hypothetical protein